MILGQLKMGARQAKNAALFKVHIIGSKHVQSNRYSKSAHHSAFQGAH